MKRSLVLGSIVLLFLLAVMGGGSYYWHLHQSYIVTEIAQVKAPTDIITAESTGMLDWKVRTGDFVKADEVLGSLSPIQPSPLASPLPLSGDNQKKEPPIGTSAPGEMTQPAGTSQKIRTPINGSIIRSIPPSEQVTVQGMPLAMVADLSDLYIMAYVDESRIAEVEKGRAVDIRLDADPDTLLKGKVLKIGKKAGDTFPEAAKARSGNHPKEVQRIPVYIEVDFQDHDVALGMNAHVKIHKP